MERRKGTNCKCISYHSKDVNNKKRLYSLKEESTTHHISHNKNANGVLELVNI